MLLHLAMFLCWLYIFISKNYYKWRKLLHDLSCLWILKKSLLLYTVMYIYPNEYSILRYWYNGFLPHVLFHYLVKVEHWLELHTDKLYNLLAMRKPSLLQHLFCEVMLTDDALVIWPFFDLIFFGWLVFMS